MVDKVKFEKNNVVMALVVTFCCFVYRCTGTMVLYLVWYPYSYLVPVVYKKSWRLSFSPVLVQTVAGRRSQVTDSRESRCGSRPSSKIDTDGHFNCPLCFGNEILLWYLLCPADWLIACPVSASSTTGTRIRTVRARYTLVEDLHDG